MQQAQKEESVETIARLLYRDTDMAEPFSDLSDGEKEHWRDLATRCVAEAMQKTRKEESVAAVAHLLYRDTGMAEPFSALSNGEKEHWRDLAARCVAEIDGSRNPTPLGPEAADLP